MFAERTKKHIKFSISEKSLAARRQLLYIYTNHTDLENKNNDLFFYIY